MFPFEFPNTELAAYREKITTGHPPKLKLRALNEWLGSYYKYPTEMISNFPNIDAKELTRIGLSPLGNMPQIQNSIHRMDEDGSYGPLETDVEGFDKYGNQERTCGYTPHAVPSESAILRGVPLGVFAKTASSLFFEVKNQNIAGGIPIGYLYAENSAHLCVYAAWRFKERLAEINRDPSLRREIQMLGVESANHFVSEQKDRHCRKLIPGKLHWDDPRKFFNAIDELIRNIDTIHDKRIRKNAAVLLYCVTLAES